MNPVTGVMSSATASNRTVSLLPSRVTRWGVGWLHGEHDPRAGRRLLDLAADLRHAHVADENEFRRAPDDDRLADGRSECLHEKVDRRHPGIALALDRPSRPTTPRPADLDERLVRDGDDALPVRVVITRPLATRSSVNVRPNGGSQLVQRERLGRAAAHDEVPFSVRRIQRVGGGLALQDSHGDGGNDCRREQQQRASPQSQDRDHM